MVTRRSPTPARRTPTEAAPYHHGDLRQALCNAAWAAIERDGVEALSLRKLAAELGVSHAAPAHHFRDKDDLLEAVRLLAWQRFAAVLGDSSGQPLPLRAMGHAYIDFVLAHPNVARLMFRQRAQAASAAVSAQSEQAWQLLLRAVLDFRANARTGAPRTAAAGTSATPGDAQDPAAAVAAVAVWAQVHGLALLWSDQALPPALRDGAQGLAVRAAAMAAIERGILQDR